MLLSVDQFVFFGFHSSELSDLEFICFFLQGLWPFVHYIMVLRYFYASSFVLFSVLMSLILFISSLSLFLWFFFGWSSNKVIYHFILVSCLLSGCSFVFPFALCQSWSCLFTDVFKSEMWSEVFASYLRLFSPRLLWWKAPFLLPRQKMVLFVPTSEVLKDGNVGLPPITSVIFHLIRSRSQSTCSVCLMKLILLLQFLTRSTALTGRYSWYSCKHWIPAFPLHWLALIFCEW